MQAENKPQDIVVGIKLALAAENVLPKGFKPLSFTSPLRRTPATYRIGLSLDKKEAAILLGMTALKLEARVGIEPTHRGFADLGLTTWLPRLEKRTKNGGY